MIARVLWWIVGWLAGAGGFAAVLALAVLVYLYL